MKTKTLRRTYAAVRLWGFSEAEVRLAARRMKVKVTRVVKRPIDRWVLDGCRALRVPN